MSIAPDIFAPPLELDALRVAVEHTPLVMAMLDCDYRYICASRRWRQVTPVPDDSAVGKLHFDAFPTALEVWKPRLDRCLQGAIESCDRDSWTDPKGHTTWFRWEIRPWHDPQGRIAGVLIIADNVTELAVAEERQRQSAALLRTFFDSSPVLMGVVELLENDVRYIDANTASARFFNLPAAENLVGRHASEFRVSDASLQAWIGYLRRAAREGTIRFTAERPTATGVRILDVTLTPTPASDGPYPRFCYLIQDVTEAHHALKALAASEERLAFALNAMEEGVWDWDVADDRVLASHHIYQQLGLPPADTHDSFEEWLRFGHPDDVPTFRKVMEDHLAGRTAIAEMEYRMLHRDGHYIWFYGRGRVVKRDAQGNPLRLVATQMDITKRKAVEEELRRAKEAAQAASEAKSAFLANMSHEIRTPLTSLLGYADVLREPDLPTDQRTQFVNIIRRSGRHLMALINNFLDLSKIESGIFTVERLDFQLEHVVDEVALLLRERALEKHLAFSTLCPPNLRLLSDPTRLRQILANLLDNGIKFTPPGGSVAISVRLGCAPDADADATPQRIFFDVSDTGIGISGQQSARLFQPFVQADGSTTRKFGGTGLGLAISRHLARLLGGDIDLHSIAGAGSTFTLWLPYVERPAHTLASADATTVARPLTAHILLVDDSEDLQLLITHVLQRAGATVDVAHDGADGVRKVMTALTNNRPYDMVLMDIQMPGTDGNAAARELRQRGVQTPILALSASAMEKNRAEALAAGCSDFLVKPLDTGRLLEVIHSWVDRTREANPAARVPVTESR